MTFLTSLNTAADEVLNAFWHSVSVLSDDEELSEPEAFSHLRQAVLARIKAVKLTHGVDYVPDGRAARWRVRLTLWRGADPDTGDLHGDSDEGAPLSKPGATLIHGLPAVAAWVWELIGLAHPGCVIEELSLAAVRHKLRTLRVALSNQGGACAWRLRYSVSEPTSTRALNSPAMAAKYAAQRAARGEAEPAAPITREAVAYLALIQVSREEPAPRRLKE